MKLRFSKEVLTIIAFSITTLVNAQTWVGGGSNWNDPTNWSTNPSLPANNSTITIDGMTATVDVASGFRPGTINVINGGELIINNSLDISSEGLTTIDGSGSKLTVNVGGLFTSEFITVTNSATIEITGGELDVNDQLSMNNGFLTVSDGLLDYNGGTGEELIFTDTDVSISGGLLDIDRGITVTGGEITISGGELDSNDQLSITGGTFNLSGGLLDYNGGTDEELLFTNSNVTISGGLLEFHRGIIVSGGDFDLQNGGTMTATNTGRNLEFHNAEADMNGTVNNADGDLSLFGTSTVNLLTDLTMDLDDLVMNDDGLSSTLNVWGTLVAFDDVKFDEDPPDDVAGDNDQIIVKDGGSLTINDSFRDADQVEAGSGIHAESGAEVEIADIPGMTNEEAYGTILTSDPGANLSVEGGDPLPVELIFFEGEAVAHGILLKWSTATETNNDYFEVLRSIDGKEFDQVGRVKGRGNSNEISEYSFTDIGGNNEFYFYQLKQVDFNGDHEYHTVIRVSHTRSSHTKVSVFPNPIVTNQVNIVSQKNMILPTLYIYSMSGKLLLETELHPGSHWILDVPGMNLEKGINILKVNDIISGYSSAPIKVIMD